MIMPEMTNLCTLVPSLAYATMTHLAADDRYDIQPYRRCGRSGLLLPVISLGFWHNFGDDKPLETQRAVMRRAFDLGVTHFDLANNYGPPYGSAETNAGDILRQDFRPYRDELIISSKAGWDMWPGPYGDHGSRKYLIASLDQSLQRLGLDYVDIFYHHRPDPETPLEETMGALDAIVRSGKALYAGVSSYSPDHTAKAAEILRGLGTPLVIHQPSYSMFNRWIEPELLDTLDREGAGLHRLQRACPRPADRPLFEGSAGGLPSRAGQVPRPLLDRRQSGPDQGARGDRRRPWSKPRPAGPVLGAPRSPGDLGTDRSEQRGTAGGQRRRGAATGARPRTSWPRSMRTPSIPASISGPTLATSTA